jgi:Ser/Thr protein kinase RdoA (MazF antagonist)
MAGSTDPSVLDRMWFPRPDITQEEAKAILLQHYNLSGRLKELVSQQDRNYLISTTSQSFVLKICLAEYALLELEAQVSALQHLLTKPGVPRVPSIIPTTSGESMILLEIKERKYCARLLEYLEGEPVIEVENLSPELIRSLGVLAATLTLGLADFEHPGLNRSLQWNLHNAGPVADHLLSSVHDDGRRDRMSWEMASALTRLKPLEKDLRIQTVYHDLAGDNLLCRKNQLGALIPDAVIDFGDIVRGWLVSDLVVLCAWLLQYKDDDIQSVLPAIVAYHEICPLNDAELRAIWPMVIVRSVVLLASSEQQLSVDPANKYACRDLEVERSVFERVISVDADLVHTKINEAL